MNVLGIDTSSPASAACVLREDGEAFEVIPDPAALLGRPGHARELMPAVARCLDDAGLGFAELDAVAVGIGPGPFTGLRIGVTTARAVASARGLGLRAVSSLEALALGIDAPLRLPLIDAGRGEVFGALYDEDGERIGPFAAVPEEVVARVREPGADPLAAGGGSVRFRELLEASGLRVAEPGSGAHVARGLSVCRLAEASPPTAPEGVLPDYLRLPDAKPR